MCQVIWQQLAGDGELSHMAANSDRQQLLLLLVGDQILKVSGHEEKKTNQNYLNSLVF